MTKSNMTKMAGDTRKRFWYCCSQNPDKPMFVLFDADIVRKGVGAMWLEEWLCLAPKS
jgi:hypothetical protein